MQQATSRRDQNGHSRTLPPRATRSPRRTGSSTVRHHPLGVNPPRSGREPGRATTPGRGSRGSGGLGQRGAGSVSSQVACDAPCPVVIISRRERPARRARGGRRPVPRQPGTREGVTACLLTPAGGWNPPRSEVGWRSMARESYEPDGEIPGNTAQAGDDRRGLRRGRGRAGA